MKDKPTDRRVQRTRKLLRDALIALILEKGYDQITVQNIIDRANIGRSTFYAHYLDKEDLMEHSLEKLREELEQHMAETAGDEEREAPIPSLPLFRHTQKQHHLYKAMIGGRGIDIVVKAINEALVKHAEAHFERLESDGRRLTIPLPVATTYLAGSLQILLRWWLDNGMPYTPERMDEMFRQLTTPGISAAVTKAL